MLLAVRAKRDSFPASWLPATLIVVPSGTTPQPDPDQVIDPGSMPWIAEVTDVSEFTGQEEILGGRKKVVTIVHAADEADVTVGSVTLTFQANATSPCSSAATSPMYGTVFSNVVRPMYCRAAGSLGGGR